MNHRPILPCVLSHPSLCFIHSPSSPGQVLLLPKPLLYLQSDILMGRPLPSHCAADKDEPIRVLGPWRASEALEQQLAEQQLDTRDYFFAYICTKPQIQSQSEAEGREHQGEGDAAPEAATPGNNPTLPVQLVL